MRVHPSDAVRVFFRDHRIDPCTLVIAASGGIDSTALLLLLGPLRDEGFELRAAHVNHHLRGEESDGDEAFVRALCAELELPLDVAEGALDPERIRARGIEAAARDVRYRRLTHIREACGARFVATAHQKDDQAETVLMRMLTGAGLAGLRGIHPVRDDGFIRPLLRVSRSELERVLSDRGITARIDRSNADRRFLRNRLRPLIREWKVTSALAAIAVDAQAQWPILERAIDDADRSCSSVRNDATRFETLPENEWLRRALLLRHVRRLDPDAREMCVRSIDFTKKRTTVTKRTELVREGASWCLRRKTAALRFPLTFEMTFIDEATVSALNSTIKVAPIDPEAVRRGRSRDGARQCFQLPEGGAAVFTVRTRRIGDRFQPLGSPHAKKLKDFFIDRKIDRDIRDRTLLLLWNDEIVWIAGVEVSERFKVTSPVCGALYEVWLEGSGANDANHSPL